MTLEAADYVVLQRTEKATENKNLIDRTMKAKQ